MREKKDTQAKHDTSRAENKQWEIKEWDGALMLLHCLHVTKQQKVEK